MKNFKNNIFCCVRFLIFLSFSVTFVSKAQRKQTTKLKLWYEQPAGSVWENALPVGNGMLAAMVYGNVAQEIVKLNEHTLWSGSPNRNDVPETLAALNQIRQLIFDGKHKEAENLSNKVMFGKKSSGQIFQPAGNLHLDFPQHENYTNYHRELDIEKAMTQTSYTVGDVTYTRSAFAAFADRVIVMQLTANKPSQISFTASYTSPHKKKSILVSVNRDVCVGGLTRQI